MSGARICSQNGYRIEQQDFQPANTIHGPNEIKHCLRRVSRAKAIHKGSAITKAERQNRAKQRGDVEQSKKTSKASRPQSRPVCSVLISSYTFDYMHLARHSALEPPSGHSFRSASAVAANIIVIAHRILPSRNRASLPATEIAVDAKASAIVVRRAVSISPFDRPATGADDVDCAWLGRTSQGVGGRLTVATGAYSVSLGRRNRPWSSSRWLGRDVKAVVCKLWGRECSI